MEKSVNEWMVIKKELAERKSDLKALRGQSAIKTRQIRRYGDEITEDINEVQYNTKELDRRITEIQNVEMSIESAIKQSNALTQLNINADVEKLLSPME
jgi:hypothetical protein